MAAQILPLIDGVQQGLEQQRYVAQAQNQARQQALQEAQFQSEQMMQPIRQEILKAELAKNLQSMDLTAKSFLSGQHAQEQESDLRQQANNRANTESNFNYGDHGAAIARYQNELLQNQLGTQQLDERTQKMVEDRSSHLALLSQLPKAARLAALQPYQDPSDPSGFSLGKPTVDQILSAPEPARARKSYADFLSEQLGESAAADYERFQDDIKTRQKLAAGGIEGFIGESDPQAAMRENQKQLLADLAGIVQIHDQATKGKGIDEKVSKIKPPSPKGDGKMIDSKTAGEYLKRAGGDRSKAMTLAEADGWKVE